MNCVCYITDLISNKSFFDDILFADFNELDNFIGLMFDNDFRVDRVVVSDTNEIIYDILEV